jgi:hypothetical protein
MVRGAQEAAPPATDPVAAEVLFQEGRRLLKAGDVFSAREKLIESLRLDPAVGTLANLAECEETLGRTASAWQRWRQAADQMSSRDPRRRQALARAARLEKIVPRLRITVASGAPASIRVERDGVRLGEATFGVSMPIDPGHHVVVSSTLEHWPLRFDLIMTEGETRSLEVDVGPLLEPVPPEAPPTPAPAPGVRPAAPPPAGPPVASGAPALPSLATRAALPASFVSRLQRSDWVLLGVGVAGAGVATLFGVQALSARRDASEACPRQAGLTRCWSSAQQPLDRDRRRSLLADVGLVAGAAAASTAAYFLTRPRPTEERDGPSRLMAAPLPGGGEVQVVGNF